METDFIDSANSGDAKTSTLPWAPEAALQACATVDPVVDTANDRRWIVLMGRVAII